MATNLTYSVPNSVLEALVDQGRAADMSPQLYAKYVMLMALGVVSPSEVAEYKRAYDRRLVTEKAGDAFIEKLKNAKPFGAF